MTSKRSPVAQAPAIRAIAVLRKHSRACRNLETREYLFAVERRLVQLVDLEQQDRQQRWAAE